VIRPIRESPLVVLANAGTHCSVTSEFSSNGNTVPIFEGPCLRNDGPRLFLHSLGSGRPERRS
jgi:hypothetical protein